MRSAKASEATRRLAGFCLKVLSLETAITTKMFPTMVRMMTMQRVVLMVAIVRVDGLFWAGGGVVETVAVVMVLGERLEGSW